MIAQATQFFFTLQLALASPSVEVKVQSIPAIVPTQWTYTCPIGQIGLDNQPLCYADYTLRSFRIARTDSGIQLRWGGCAIKQHGRLGYTSLVMDVPFAPTAPSAEIEQLIASKFDRLNKLALKRCEGTKVEQLDRSQLGSMIGWVFVSKRLPK